MNTMNDLIQMMQLSAAAQTRRTQSTQRRESEKDSEGSSFDQLLRDRTESGEQPQTTKPGRAGAAQEETTPDETLREVAAAMTAMMPQVPVQIQTEEVQPQTAQQITAAVQPDQQMQPQPVQQTAQTELFAAETPAAETAQALAQPTDVQAVDASAAEAAMPEQADLTAPKEVTQSQSETTDRQQNGELTDRGGRADDVKVENAPQQTEQPVFHEVKSVPVKVGETMETADAESPKLDAQLAQSVTSALKNGAKQVKLQLNPENLGTLTIDLTRTQDGALQVVLHTTTEKAADLLGRHAESLGAMLQNNTQTAVTVQVQRQEQPQQFQQFQQNAQHQQQEQPRHNSRRQSEEDFLQQLRLGLVTLEELAV